MHKTYHATALVFNFGNGRKILGLVINFISLFMHKITFLFRRKLDFLMWSCNPRNHEKYSSSTVEYLLLTTAHWQKHLLTCFINRIHKSRYKDKILTFWISKFRFKNLQNFVLSESLNFSFKNLEISSFEVEISIIQKSKFEIL